MCDRCFPTSFLTSHNSLPVHLINKTQGLSGELVTRMVMISCPPASLDSSNTHCALSSQHLGFIHSCQIGWMDFKCLLLIAQRRKRGMKYWAPHSTSQASKYFSHEVLPCCSKCWYLCGQQPYTLQELKTYQHHPPRNKASDMVSVIQHCSPPRTKKMAKYCRLAHHSTVKPCSLISRKISHTHQLVDASDLIQQKHHFCRLAWSRSKSLTFPPTPYTRFYSKYTLQRNSHPFGTFVCSWVQHQTLINSHPHRIR